MKEEVAFCSFMSCFSVGHRSFFGCNIHNIDDNLLFDCLLTLMNDDHVREKWENTFCGLSFTGITHVMQH